MFAEAIAFRSAADLWFDICDDLPTLGCFCPVVWAEKRAYMYMGDDSDTEEYYPYGRFGGFTWDANLSRGEAQNRCKEAINLLHLGEVPQEMADVRPQSFLCGNVCSMACPAIPRASMVNGHRLRPRLDRPSRGPCPGMPFEGG